MLRGIFNQGLDPFDLGVAILSVLIVAVTAFAYHEYAHAIVADRLGDPTPRRNGRITLNPFPHLDAMGMILLLFIGFGWATTPVNPSLLRGDTRKSMALVAVAGPIANLIMAFIFSIPYQLVNFGLLDATTFFDGNFAFFFRMGLYINILLFVFNLLPIPPLDGFTILTGILPKPMAAPLVAFRNSAYSVYLLIGLIFLLPYLGYDIIGFIFPIVDTIINFLIS